MPILIAAVATATAAGLGACSGVGTPPTATPTAAPGGYTPTTADQAAVATVFRDHNQALLSHDFTTACSFNDPAINQQLVASAAAGGGQVSSCPDALRKLYTNPNSIAVANGIARTAQITDIHVNGDTATITWSVQARGKQTTTTSDMRRIAGQWRLTGPTTPR